MTRRWLVVGSPGVPSKLLLPKLPCVSAMSGTDMVAPTQVNVDPAAGGEMSSTGTLTRTPPMSVRPLNTGGM